jgi:hypothetical protein
MISIVRHPRAQNEGATLMTSSYSKGIKILIKSGKRLIFLQWQSLSAVSFRDYHMMPVSYTYFHKRAAMEKTS